MAHVRSLAGNHPISEDMLENRGVARLMARHEALEAELAEKSSGLLVDWDGVRLIKKRKLEVAEQLEALRRNMQ